MSSESDVFIVVVYSFSLSNSINHFYGDSVSRCSMDAMRWFNYIKEIDSITLLGILRHFNVDLTLIMVHSKCCSFLSHIRVTFWFHVILWSLSNLMKFMSLYGFSFNKKINHLKWHLLLLFITNKKLNQFFNIKVIISYFLLYVNFLSFN